MRQDERWASVSRDLSPTVSAYRHVVPRRGVTSACGATGLPLTVWRGNTAKPACPTCLDVLARRDAKGRSA